MKYENNLLIGKFDSLNVVNPPQEKNSLDVAPKQGSFIKHINDKKHLMGSSFKKWYKDKLTQ